MNEPIIGTGHGLLDLPGLREPILQAPMAGFASAAMAISIAQAGGLGALACAVLSEGQVREAVDQFRREVPGAPLNLNFFCHHAPEADDAREARWRALLEPYYREYGIDSALSQPAPSRRPFDEAACALVEELRPEVVSFHFGLPEAVLLERVKATGAGILSSATTLEEALWLENRSCDAIIAQGLEAGGHRGLFLSPDLDRQVGTLALLRQVVARVRKPVIAAGGIGDGRGIAACLALGAAAVQVGTAYLLCPEATISAVHRRELERATTDSTAVTNLMTGRPARGLLNRLMREHGPLSAVVPEFPLASAALAPLRQAAEAVGKPDFSPLWCGQYPPKSNGLPAGELTRQMLIEAAEVIRPGE